MRIGRSSVMVALLAVLVLAAPIVANAATVRVTGTTTEVSPGTCGELVLTGRILSVHCVGLVETWAGGISGTGVFDEAASLNVVSGEVRVGGSTSITDACVGDSCGTLESSWHGSGRVDLETFGVIFIDGEQHFTGGTGDLDGAKGSIRFSLIGEGPATYEGLIVL